MYNTHIHTLLTYFGRMLSHTLKVTIIICIFILPLLYQFGGTLGSYMCDSKVDYISITFQILGRRDIWARQLPCNCLWGSGGLWSFSKGKCQVDIWLLWALLCPTRHTNGNTPLELLELVAERAFCAQGASDFQFLFCQEDHSKPLSSKTIQCGNENWSSELEMMLPAYNPSTAEAKAGGLWVSD